MKESIDRQAVLPYTKLKNALYAIRISHGALTRGIASPQRPTLRQWCRPPENILRSPHRSSFCCLAQTTRLFISLRAVPG